MDLKKSFAIGILIPAVIAFVLIGYYLSSIHGKPIEGLTWGHIVLPLVLSFVVAFIYFFTRLRSIVTSYKERKIALNVKTTLYNLSKDKFSSEQKQRLFEDDGLLAIFDELVNESDVLKSKRAAGRFNEIIWVATADIGILSLFCSIAFFVSIFFYPEIETELIIKGFGISLLSIIALAAHNMSYMKGIQLSNDLLSYIEKNRLNQLDEKVKTLLK